MLRQLMQSETGFSAETIEAILAALRTEDEAALRALIVQLMS